MSAHFDEKWLAEYLARGGKILAGAAVADGGPGEGWNRESAKVSGQTMRSSVETEDSKRPKYGNVKAERDGKRFDSRHEAKIYEELRLRCLAGEYAGLGRQVAFFLPGGVKYIADFVTLNKDGSYSVLDAKSEATRRDKVYRLKRRQMKECLGIEIEEV